MKAKDLYWYIDGKKFFKCERCEGEYETQWAQEDADAEAKKLYGIEKASERDDQVLLCDTCFEWLTQKMVEQQMSGFDEPYRKEITKQTKL